MKRILFIILPLVFFSLSISCSRTCQVSTESMMPTLKPDDRIRIIKKPGYEPKRGDIIAYQSPIASETDKIFIHRCIAVEGERFEIKDDAVYINGTILSEPYAKGNTELYHDEPGAKDIRGVVPEGMIVTLGDNRDKAFDSRTFGYTPVESVIGRVEKTD